MKNYVNILCITVILALGFQGLLAQDSSEQLFNLIKDKLNQESITSMNEAIDGMEWNQMDFKDGLDNQSQELCFPKFIEQLNKHEKLRVDRTNKLVPYQVFKFWVLLQEQLKIGRYQNIEGADNPFLENARRDRILRKLKHDISHDDFVNEVVGKGSISKDDREALEGAFSFFKFNFVRDNAALAGVREFKSGLCKIKEEFIIRFKEIDFNNQRIVYTVSRIFKADCECSGPNGEFDLRNGLIVQQTLLYGNYGKTSLTNMRFSADLRSTVSNLRITCCPVIDGDTGGSEDANDTGGDKNGDDSENSDNEDNKSGGYYDPGDSEKENCCYNETANSSIGAFPILQFGNNFEDSTIGIGVEFLHSIGTSFGNNRLFVGASGLFASSNGANGELTENYYAGMAIIENRTPVIPCFQWTQRFSAGYGEGTLDSFGSKDEFSQLIFGIHTGINIDLSNRVSVFGDAALIEFGKQNYTAENGLEAKTDIGNLGLGRQTFQLGVRLKFQ